MAFSMYEGESKKGKRHGLGRYVYSDGAVYEGLWENDKCNGWGVYTFPDGEGYEGFWKNGKMHGNAGKFTYKSGRIKKGKWINNVYQKPKTSNTTTWKPPVKKIHQIQIEQSVAKSR